ncbi:MAG: hypothetical protein JWN44_1000 [Myxococcales bacterium]|nr:hypothetical protein [Myxococcales bacterium]
MTPACPWCDAPREPGPRCSRCGAIYAKAEALKAGIDPVAATSPATVAAEPGAPETRWSGDAEELAAELTLRASAVPVALAVAALFHAFPLGHFLQRTFLTMMVHELGHAVTAWWCGFAAFPFLWRTLIAGERGPLTALVVAAGSGALLVWSLRARHPRLIGLAASLLALQLGATVLLRARNAQALVTFGGDGGAMVLGTLLMASFYVDRDTYIRRNALRWGFLVIGAAAFTDTFATWWQARRDYDVIPFGEIEGVGLSDPSKLVDVYGWTTRALVQRYVTLGIVCLVALAAVWAWGTWQTRRELAALSRS